MCYEYRKNPDLKQHQHFLEFADEWEGMPSRERKFLLEERLTKGFKRPSMLRFWDKFDMVYGFCLDVMHQYDEGVVRWMVGQIVALDGNSGITKAQFNDIERRWLSIIVPGHESRKVRSLRDYKTWKGHELRFFIQHCAPFVLKDNCPEGFYFQICLLSRVAWLVTQDEVTQDDVKEVESKSIRFVKAFQEYFGVDQMKYSIHLMIHIALALKLFGPLHLVSCYRPENELGRVARRICGTYNSTKNIMDSFLKLNECAARMQEMLADNNAQVVATARCILGILQTPFVRKSSAGTCRLIGKPEDPRDGDPYDALQKQAHLLKEHWSPEHFLFFKRAALESGIFVRTSWHNKLCNRNEYIVMDGSSRVLKVRSIIAVMDATKTTVVHTFIFGTLLEHIEEEEFEGRIAGMYKAECPHIFLAKPCKDILVKTSEIKKQMVYLGFSDTHRALFLSSPSNMYMTT